MSRDKRLSRLREIPPIAAVDHRFFLNDKGQDARLQRLPRKARRELKSQGWKLAEKYNAILRDIRYSGVGYPVDQLLRDLAVEYTHRYASSGVMNQPTSFNYFEAFCAIDLIAGSVAPYAEPRQELDHLFNVADYFDYLTSEDTPQADLSDLLNLPEGRIHHFTQNGSIDDFTFMTAEGREFVISGFSMVRHGNSLHWYVLGGEVLPSDEWEKRVKKGESEIKIEVPLKSARFFLKV
jgi:hypothetical protein